MRDPVRLLEGGDALEARVLGSAREDRAPDHLRERVLQLAAVTAATATAATTASAATAKASSALGTAAIAKWAAAVAVVGAVTAGGAYAVDAVKVTPTTSLAPSPPPVKKTAPAAPPQQPRAEAPAVPAASPAIPAPGARSASAPSPSAGASLLRELALLDAARSALDGDDTSLAIRQLDRHDLDYPRGQLASDALALRVEVYAKRQDTAKVDELAHAFLARYPDHPQAPRVRALSEGTRPTRIP